MQTQPLGHWHLAALCTAVLAAAATHRLHLIVVDHDSLAIDCRADGEKRHTVKTGCGAACSVTLGVTAGGHWHKTRPGTRCSLVSIALSPVLFLPALMPCLASSMPSASAACTPERMAASHSAAVVYVAAYGGQ